MRTAGAAGDPAGAVFPCGGWFSSLSFAGSFGRSGSGSPVRRSVWGVWGVWCFGSLGSRFLCLWPALRRLPGRRVVGPVWRRLGRRPVGSARLRGSSRVLPVLVPGRSRRWACPVRPPGRRLPRLRSLLRRLPAARPGVLPGVVGGRGCGSLGGVGWRLLLRSSALAVCRRAGRPSSRPSSRRPSRPVRRSGRRAAPRARARSRARRLRRLGRRPSCGRRPARARARWSLARSACCALWPRPAALLSCSCPGRAPPAWSRRARGGLGRRSLAPGRRLRCAWAWGCRSWWCPAPWPRSCRRSRARPSCRRGRAVPGCRSRRRAGCPAGPGRPRPSSCRCSSRRGCAWWLAGCGPTAGARMGLVGRRCVRRPLPGRGFARVRPLGVGRCRIGKKNVR
jgi:hypothetical protein